MAADLRSDIADAKARLRGPTIGAGRELRKLADHLGPDETVRAVAVGTFAGGTGLLALTERRILFVLEGLTKRTIEDFPLRSVTSITSRTGIVNGSILIATGGARAEVTAVYKDDAKSFVDLARESVAVHGAVASSQPVAPAPSTADELVKLAGLRAQGVLTDAEFAAAKARLLA